MQSSWMVDVFHEQDIEQSIYDAIYLYNNYGRILVHVVRRLEDKMAKKRERLEVIYDILDCVRASNAIKPTRLQQKSNLSPQMFKEYIDELLEKGLLVFVERDGHKEYAITDKGYEFLAKYKQAMELIANFGL